MKVSVHELKNHLSKYLHLIKEGEPIIITSHHAPIAKLLPIEVSNENLKELMAAPGIHWNGKKPRGGQLRPAIEGKTVAEYVLEDRR
ncbi:MAG: type II toxin-antitoxin system prevent-host-death family antitoxin [Gammaproteobacteria bacterium]|nr:MAG: type II toxin-antitoxin system prevent-host-death family antitoxin [Gammaproteobacteria bacterium]